MLQEVNPTASLDSDALFLALYHQSMEMVSIKMKESHMSKKSARKATEAFVKDAMVQAVEIVTELTTDSRLSIKPSSVRVIRTAGWYYLAFGDADNLDKPSAACTLHFHQNGCTCGFYHFIFQGTEPFRSQRWFDLQRPKSFCFRRDPDNRAVYVPPIPREVLLDQLLAL
ncbi:MAG: hypothetical protein WA082_04035 [Candidatus Moraniibacteriota bacterium]